MLRNNITTADRPLGVFHPKPSLHHIKKENIGLIEVMGLAVLPSRLSREIVMLEKAMLGGEDLRGIPELTCHAEWAAEVLSRHPEFSEGTARGILEDAGVFKRSDAGKSAFMRFVDVVVK